MKSLKLEELAAADTTSYKMNIMTYTRSSIVFERLSLQRCITSKHKIQRRARPKYNTCSHFNDEDDYKN